MLTFRTYYIFVLYFTLQTLGLLDLGLQQARSNAFVSDEAQISGAGVHSFVTIRFFIHFVYVLTNMG